MQKILENIEKKIDRVDETVSDTRDRVMVLEGQDTSNRIKHINDKVEGLNERITKTETRHGMLVTVLSLVVSTIVTFTLKVWPN